MHNKEWRGTRIMVLVVVTVFVSHPSLALAAQSQAMKSELALPPIATGAPSHPLLSRADTDCLTTERLVAPSPQVESSDPRRLSDLDEARIKGEEGGKKSVSSATWLIVGCLLPLPTVIAAYVWNSDPPASQLVGRSAEYVNVYSDTWRRNAKAKRTKHAWIGAAIGFTAAVLLISASTPR